MYELARRNGEEASRVEQVRALLAASASPPSGPSCGGGGYAGNNIETSPARGESKFSSTSGGSVVGARPGCTSAERFTGVPVGGRMGLGVGGGTGGSSVAATALSELAALEEVIAERAREVASLKVWREKKYILCSGVELAVSVHLLRGQEAA